MRFPARLILTGAALFVSASCANDQPLSPSGVPSVDGNPSLRALVVEQTVDLVIPANGGELNVFNVYQLNVPAGAVCDPDAADTQAGYAAQAWNAGCTPANRDIAIRATAKWTNGTLSVDFQPALRFVPSANVTLSTDVYAPVVKYYGYFGLKRGYPINYAPAIGAPEVADALSDPSVRTKIDPTTGRLSRRIKHFSGYQILGTGIPCNPADGDPLCVWVGEEEIHK